MKIVTIAYDESAESPSENDLSWTIHSFRRGCEDPHKYIHAKNGEIRANDIGLQRKLEVGTAFILSCYEHGNVAWSLKGEGMQCQWDTTQVAGILIFNGKACDLPKGYEARQKDARGFLETYNNWCNGQVYGYTVEEEIILSCGHKEMREVDSCWGFFDTDHMAEEIKAAIAGDTFTVKGNCRDLAQYIDLGKGAE